MRCVLRFAVWEQRGVYSHIYTEHRGGEREREREREREEKEERETET